MISCVCRFAQISACILFLVCVPAHETAHAQAGRPAQPATGGREVVLPLVSNLNGIFLAGAPGCSNTAMRKVPRGKQMLAEREELWFCANQLTEPGLPGLAEVAHLSGFQVALSEQPEPKMIEAIGKCGSLEHLEIRKSEVLRDSTVAPLAKLKHLRSLGFNGCQAFTGKGLAWLKDLPELTELDLSNTSLNDTDLAVVAGATGIKSLHIGCCQSLLGPGLKCLSALKFLKQLDILGHNLDMGQWPDLPPFPSLEDLDLSRGPGGESMLRWAASNKTLVRLGFSGMKTCDKKILKCLAGHPALRELDLSDWSETGLDVVALTEVSKIAGLRKLRLNFNLKLEDAALTPISALAELEELDLSLCPGIRGACLPGLVSLKHLSRLSLATCSVRDAQQLEVLGSAPALSELDLRQCECDNKTIMMLSKIATLTKLSLSGGYKLESVALKQLAACPHLATLVFDRCAALNDEAAGALATFPALEELVIHGTSSLSKVGMKSLAAVLGLRVLSVDFAPLDLETAKALASLKLLRTLVLTDVLNDGSLFEALEAFPALEELTFVPFKDLDAKSLVALVKARKLRYVILPWYKIELKNLAEARPDLRIAGYDD